MDEAGLLAFGDEQIDGFGAGGFDIGAGGVKVSVVGHDVAGFSMTLKRMRSAARPW